MGPLPEFPFVHANLTELIVFESTRSLGRPGLPDWGPVVTFPEAAANKWKETIEIGNREGREAKLTWSVVDRLGSHVESVRDRFLQIVHEEKLFGHSLLHLLGII